MKRFLFLLSISLCFLQKGWTQNVSINTTGDAAHPSAILDVTSTDKGVLVPRMASFQRAMIVNPAQGLLVYDTDSRSFWFHDGAWKELGASGLPGGQAGGDLNGNYPSPNVVKIQNLDIEFGVPFDKQVLKWDAINNNWKGRNDSLFLPYNATFSNPDKLFAITNTSPMNNTAIYGKRLSGSGLGLSTSNGVWGDNLDGNGIAGTSATGVGVAGFADAGIGVSATSISGNAMNAFSTSGVGISSQSISNFGLASSSQGIDKAGLVGVNNGNAGNGYGVIGLIENPTGGSAMWGKNNATAGNAGLFTTINTSNVDPALKVSTSGNGAAAYFTTTGLGPAGYFVHNNASNINPAIFVSNSSNGTGITVSQNATNTTHGIYVNHNGSGKSIFSTSEQGQAGKFDIINVTNDKATLESTTIGKGNAAVFIKNNTTGSTSDVHKPAVLIDNNSKGAALKIQSLHSPSANHGIDVQYGGDAYGININAVKLGLHAFTSDANGASIVAENYGGGHGIKAYTNASSKAAFYAENSNMFGRGFETVLTGSQATGVRATVSSATAAIHGINNGDSGCALKALTNAPSFGIGILGESSSTSWGVPAHFISNCPDAITHTLWLRDHSKGQTVRIQIENQLNDKEALYITSNGTGKFVSLNNDDGERLSISNGGNVITEGNITVKGNKGIVRNSSSTQMRMEVVNAVFNPAGSETLSPQETRNISITFATPFSSAPVVYVANITQDGGASSMQASILNVTTTGCTFHFVNPMNTDIAVSDSTWKLVVMGAE